MGNEPLIHWPDPILELLTFVASFLAAGAIGFRFSVLRAMRAPEDRPIREGAESTATALGLTGASILIVMLATRLPELAARHHVAVAELLAHDLMTQFQVAMAIAAVLGFTLARVRRPNGWALAAIGVVAGTLRPLFFGQWARLPNPAHLLAGGLWIGTLFVMVIAGFQAALAQGNSPERRGALVANMVHAFSPLALGASAMLALFGAITALLHLKPFSSLWTTPYGYTLIAKLAVVSVVVGLGAYNWRRQTPRLGTEAGAIAIRASARSELAVAAVVLIVTSILVSLPSPKG